MSAAGIKYEYERFENHCPTCGQEFLVEKVDVLTNALEVALAMILEECADAEHTHQVDVIKSALATGAA
jgi:hypothetical protein